MAARLEEALSRAMVDLDEVLLAEAAEILGTTSRRATVNGVLAEFVAARRRHAEGAAAPRC
ncbi:type II toxin-antitoxin system VapB family antitoxin [Streptomyces sp. NPDC006463]|uniref:type II toxin-antitoxin system VapB family antitoxin n=1 Tax=Streptomyces sp. NPDC006463 TaxID=3364746 RepID=UPI00367C9270